MSIHLFHAKDLPVCGILCTLGLLSSVILGVSLTQLGKSTAVREAGLEFHSMESALVRVFLSACLSVCLSVWALSAQCMSTKC